MTPPDSNEKKAGGVFYGWWIVAASIIGLSTSPGQFVFGSLGIFTLPLSEEFGWNRAEISLALTFFTISLAITLPVIGRLVDNYGSRRILLPSMLFVSLGLVLIPLVLTQLWQLYLIFVLIGILGAGANNITYLRTISAWFDKNRGLAMGIAVSGSGLGYAYMPVLVQYMIEISGWRAGYFVLAIIITLIALPLVYFMLRETPQELGLHPDGHTHSTLSNKASVESGLHRSQVLRKREFWLLFFIFCVVSFSLFGLMIHFVPLLTDRGMSRIDAAFAASTIGFTIMGARILIGYLIDRIFAPTVAFICFLLSAIGLALLATGVSGFSAFIVAMLVGASIGAEADLLAFLTSRYFGLKCFGEVYGLLFASLLIGTSLGPFVYGLSFEMSGSYIWILVFCSILCAIAAVVMKLLPHYPDFEVVDSKSD
ncbi:MAG: MFS transporter [Gammaproteobacteria bacterium]|jgi:MFS family permease|nr:MFS transporter [Gammaproteobacteria bacterium]